mgnify:CR=1 FL=1
MKKRLYLKDMETREEGNSFSVIADFEGNEEQLMDIEVNEILPILPLRNMVLFPGVFMPVSVGRKTSMKLVREAEKKSAYIGRHFWDKWSALADKSIFGAAERFFAELSENNQKLLVERAVTLYDGRAFRKEPDDSDILVCKECGSRQLEIQAWINANTDERISYVHDDNNGLWCDGKWCEECGVQVFFCTKAEFTQKMQGWWESCGFETKEQITGLKVCDSPPSENTQTFIDAADQWWNSRDYEHKREIYNRYNSKNE